MRSAARVGDWLVTALGGPAMVGSDAWEVCPSPVGLAQAASFHGVEGWVLRRVHQTGISVPGIDQAAHSALARQQRVAADLRLAWTALDQAGIAFLVVKGPALAARFYDQANLRSYVDLDLLVEPENVADAVCTLEAAGCRVLDENWPLMTQLAVNELRLLGPSGGAIDLHWSLGRLPAHKDRTPPVAALLARSTPAVDGEGDGWRTLGWADSVVHVALHAAGSGGNRLLWCADLRAGLTHREADGGELLRSAAEWSALPAVLLMLHRTGAALGASVTQGLLETAEDHSAWASLVRLTEIVQPTARSGAGRSLARVVARSAGPTTRSSWMALAGKSARAAGSWRRSPDDPALLNPANRRSAFHAAGGAPAREAFLRAVALQARSVGR